MTSANPFGPFLNVNAFKGSLEEQRQKLQAKMPSAGPEPAGLRDTSTTEAAQALQASPDGAGPMDMSEAAAVRIKADPDGEAAAEADKQEAHGQDMDMTTSDVSSSPPGTASYPAAFIACPHQECHEVTGEDRIIGKRWLKGRGMWKRECYVTSRIAIVS